MRKPKYFFASETEPEFCYSLEYFKEKLIEDGLESLQLNEAKISHDTDVFYCSEFGEPGEKSESNCGKSCESYDPRNGKSGRCRFYKNCYECGERKFLLNKDGLQEIKQGIAAEI